MTRRPKKAPAPRITRRALMLLGLQSGVIGLLGWRMRDLQIKQNEHYRLLAEENRINIRLLPPARGLIFDRSNRLMAGNRQNYRIVMVREQAGDPEAVLARLATLIDLPADKRDRALKEMQSRSAFVPVVVAEHLTWDDVVRVAANTPVLPGVIPEVGLSRFYPDGDATAHVIGYVGPVSESDLAKIEHPDPVLQIPRFQIGKTGVEHRMEDVLRGQAGNLRIEVSAGGRVMRELGRTEGTAGKDVQLTIDLALQDYAMQRMAGMSAAAVVVDVTNGDIVALASAPGFDPSSFVFGIKSGVWSALLNDEYRPLSNKTVAGTYPPGSTFKMTVALAALGQGVANPGDGVYCAGGTYLGKRRFHCWKAGGHGTVAMRRSLAQSCDCYYYEMARRVGPDAISETAKKLGMGIRHDLPMPAVAEGLMPDAAWKLANRDEKWTAGDSFNYGIGQGFTLASPLQLAVYVARIASGTAVKPRLVRAIGGVPVAVEAAPALDISPGHLDVVRGGMYAVSNEGGTASRSRIADPNMLMAGKTGTSQVRIITAAERAAGVTKNEQLPWNRRDHALFVAYAPFDRPRYAISLIVEHGGGGSAAAAPVARDILMFALYGGLPPLEAYPAEQRKAIEELRASQPLPPGAAGPLPRKGPGVSLLDPVRSGAPRGPAKLLALNWALIALLSAVAGTGFLMLYSVAGGATEPWAMPQMVRFGIGVAAMIVIALIDIRFWRAMAPVAYVVSFLLLVYVEFFGEVGMGAQRWIDLGFIVLQPSEMMKIALVMLLAFYYDWLDPAKVSHPFWVLPPLLLILAPVGLVLTQPDLGTSIMLLLGGGAMIFLAGVSVWYFAAAIASGVALVTVVLESRGTEWALLREYQFKRIETFLDPSQDPLGAGYHITQAKIAMGSGGLAGRGYMQGTQSRLNFLPEKHTDFIFTSLAEEFGFVGSVGLLTLYSLIVVFCLASAISNRDRFGALLTAGVGVTFFLFFAVNMSMVMGLMPVVGVPLPLVSYGGSAMLVLLAAFGLAQSAHVHRPRNRD